MTKVKLHPEAATRICSVKNVFFFVRPSHYGRWLTCSGRKGYGHSRLFFFPDHFTKGHQEVHYPRNSGFLVEEINSEQVPFSRIFNYSTESLYLPAHWKYLPISSLRIKYITFKQLPLRNTSEFQENR